jgi:hypothetical protein
MGTTLLIGIIPGRLPVGIPLNRHTMQQISNPHVTTRAITITPNAIAISISKNVECINPTEFV